MLMAVFGIVYLSFVDYWQIYARPLQQLKSRYENPETAGGSGTAGDGFQTEQSVSENQIAGESGTENVGEGDVAPPYATAPVVQPPDTTASDTQPPEESGAATSRSPEEVVYQSVEDDYFSDAVFIGDSRTVGMFEYGGLEEISTFYASTGLTVYKLFDSPVAAVPGQKQKQTIEEALKENSFSKIYLMIGINEMGTGTVDTFMERYREVVEHLRELQPDAIIYLQGIMKVTTERSNQGDYITNEGIEARNAEIAKLADYVQVYYLDVNPLICDESGGMEPSYTFDGVHLKAQYISVWKEFLKSHAQ